MDPNIEDHLPTSGVRPRFKIETDLQPEDISNKIQEGLKKHEVTCIGTTNPRFISLRIPLTEHHYWSPQLSITLEDTPEGSIVRGVFGPRPAVWTMFIFFYTVIGLAILVVGVLGLSKLSLDKSGDIIWLVPALLAVFFSLFGVASRGKKLGHNQMLALQNFFEKSTGLKTD